MAMYFLGGQGKTAGRGEN